MRISDGVPMLAIMRTNDPTPDASCDTPPVEEDLAGLRVAAKRLIDAIAAEPVPDKLRDLAVELGKALEHHKKGS